MDQIGLKLPPIHDDASSCLANSSKFSEILDRLVQRESNINSELRKILLKCVSTTHSRISDKYLTFEANISTRGIDDRKLDLMKNPSQWSLNQVQTLFMDCEQYFKDELVRIECLVPEVDREFNLLKNALRAIVNYWQQRVAVELTMGSFELAERTGKFTSVLNKFVILFRALLKQQHKMKHDKIELTRVKYLSELTDFKTSTWYQSRADYLRRCNQTDFELVFQTRLVDIENSVIQLLCQLDKNRVDLLTRVAEPDNIRLDKSDVLKLAADLAVLAASMKNTLLKGKAKLRKLERETNTAAQLSNNDLNKRLQHESLPLLEVSDFITSKMESATVELIERFEIQWKQITVLEAADLQLTKSLEALADWKSNALKDDLDRHVTSFQQRLTENNNVNRADELNVHAELKLIQEYLEGLVELTSQEEANIYSKIRDAFQELATISTNELSSCETLLQQFENKLSEWATKSLQELDVALEPAKSAAGSQFRVQFETSSKHAKRSDSAALGTAVTAHLIVEPCETMYSDNDMFRRLTESWREYANSFIERERQSRMRCHQDVIKRMRNRHYGNLFELEQKKIKFEAQVRHRILIMFEAKKDVEEKSNMLARTFIEMRVEIYEVLEELNRQRITYVAGFEMKRKVLVDEVHSLASLKTLKSEISRKNVEFMSLIESLFNEAVERFRTASNLIAMYRPVSRNEDVSTKDCISKVSRELQIRKEIWTRAHKTIAATMRTLDGPVMTFVHQPEKNVLASNTQKLDAIKNDVKVNYENFCDSIQEVEKLVMAQGIFEKQMNHIDRLDKVQFGHIQRILRDIDVQLHAFRAWASDPLPNQYTQFKNCLEIMDSLINSVREHITILWTSLDIPVDNSSSSAFEIPTTTKFVLRYPECILRELTSSLKSLERDADQLYKTSNLSNEVFAKYDFPDNISAWKIQALEREAVFRERIQKQSRYFLSESLTRIEKMTDLWRSTTEKILSEMTTQAIEDLKTDLQPAIFRLWETGKQRFDNELNKLKAHLSKIRNTGYFKDHDFKMDFQDNQVKLSNLLDLLTKETKEMMTKKVDQFSTEFNFVVNHMVSSINQFKFLVGTPAGSDAAPVHINQSSDGAVQFEQSSDEILALLNTNLMSASVTKLADNQRHLFKSAMEFVLKRTLEIGSENLHKELGKISINI